MNGTAFGTGLTLRLREEAIQPESIKKAVYLIIPSVLHSGWFED